MKNITLTTTADREVMVNWNNVQLAKETKNPYGDNYVEIHFGNGDWVDVKETLQEIHAKCLNAIA